MKKNVLLFILGVVALFAQPLFADHHEDQGNNEPVVRKNTIYLEGLGVAPFASLNYDRRVGDFSIRVGAGFSRFSMDTLGAKGSHTMISFPIVANYLGLGNNTHMFEIGGGFSLFYQSVTAAVDLSPLGAGVQGANASHFGLAGLLVIGYRLQAEAFNFRVGGDFFIGGGNIAVLPHLSFGVSF